MGASACVICGTPRSGSTLLCDLLAGSGVAGRPESYYRPASIAAFAAQMGLSVAAGTETRAFNQAYLRRVLELGRGGTEIFGLRLMWDGMAGLSSRLDQLFPALPTDAARFARAFGPARYLYLSRGDKVAQAVSRLKAEQTGLWHLGADGGERERSAPPQVPAYDAGQLRAYVEEVEQDEAAWAGWFASNGIAPLRLQYEELAADPRGVLRRVLSGLGLDPAHADGVEVKSSKMADTESVDWARRYRTEGGPAQLSRR